MHGSLDLPIYDSGYGVSAVILSGHSMQISSFKSQAEFGTALPIVGVFLTCVSLVTIGLHVGGGALQYIFAGMLIGGVVGVVLTVVRRQVSKRHPQLLRMLRYPRVDPEHQEECESYPDETRECPTTTANAEERMTKQREFDEMIAHIHELRKYPQAYENYEREIRNTTKLRAEYGDATQVRNERIRTQASLIEDIWQNCFRLNPYFSFIHDRSRIAAWESFAGGKSALIAVIEKRYGANIAGVYDEALPIVLNKIASARKMYG